MIVINNELPIFRLVAQSTLATAFPQHLLELLLGDAVLLLPFVSASARLLALKDLFPVSQVVATRLFALACLAGGVPSVLTFGVVAEGFEGFGFAASLA